MSIRKFRIVFTTLLLVSMRTVERRFATRNVFPAYRARHRSGAGRMMALVTTVVLLSASVTPTLVHAAPPPAVGIYVEIDENYGCELTALMTAALAGVAAGAATGAAVGILGGPIVAVGGSVVGGVVGGVTTVATDFFLSRGCDQKKSAILASVQNSFWYAYDAVEQQGATPGKPDNFVHRWAGVLIQDFKEGKDSSKTQRGDGWGAIIGEIGRDAHYIGGGFWVAYKAAVNGPNAVGTPLLPGYPTNEEHVWTGSSIRIQNFEEGTWGEAAIIGTDDAAWIVAGGHWQAYWENNGQHDLRNPLGPLYVDGDGWYTQDFEGGRIRELNGEIKVELNDETANGGEAPAEILPVGRQEPPAPSSTSGSGFFLPWQAGSVWQITSDNNGGNHADQYNDYAFDAVPVAGRSTNQITAIASGTVLGFQNDVPNEALFTSGHAGNCMMIRHGDGTVSIYAHMAAGSIPEGLRRDGAQVSSGTVIGTVGNTGLASGVHLHWSLSSDGFMYDGEGYRTCAATSIPSQYADNDAELIQDGGVPRTGRYYESTNVAGGSAVQPPVSPPIESSTDCNDTGIPQITSGLTYTPANPDTATELVFTFTITNIGCGIFQPEVLAIGGRDPNSKVSDPLQIRDFTLGPGESREISQPVVLSIPGTHEFFMVFLRTGGGWNEIPDTSGVSQHIYINVTNAPDGEAVAPEVIQGGEMAAMDIGATGPDGHAIGARFSVSTLDGTYLGSCTLDGNPDEQHFISCEVDVPRNTTVVVTLDEATIPAGMAPVENPLSFDTSGDPGAASSWGVGFQLETQGSTVTNGQSSDLAIVTTENGQPAYDVCFILVGYGLEGCDRNSDGKITFEDVPLGSYTLQQTSDLGSGREVPDSTITVTGAMESDGWERFTVEVVASSGSSSNSTSSGQSGAVDIALITRDPVDGHLLTGACYVVGQSNEGCDENGDGQVTFAEIPFGTFTVRQTQTPAGYPTINDYTIDVQPPGYMEGPVAAVPLGFIVKQALEQNVPNTRNVSVIMIDMATHEQVFGLCVELVGASNIGCDQDLVDGQIDFLDVPAGGPYELGFPNLPDGYQIGMSGGPLSVSVDAGPGDPANRTVFVLVSTTGSSGEASLEPVIEPINETPSNDAQDSATTSSDGQATLLMTFRACPEGFDPTTGDFFSECTIPLDAPDAAFYYHGGDGQGGDSIIWLDRQYNGEYVYNAGPNTMNVELSGLAPEVRDAYEVIGADSSDGSSFTINLVDGETREVYIFYYYL